ncbi:MAG: hypothetical protein ABIS07_10145, partial [Dokdonella sp.]
MSRLKSVLHRLSLACLVLASPVLVPRAFADEACVSDSANLQTQLVLLQVIQQPRTIKLVRSATAYVLGGQNNTSSAQT